MTYFGINIQNINFKQYTFKGFYLKIDKKLIVNIDQITIDNNLEEEIIEKTIMENFDFKKIKKYISIFPSILEYFQTIKINQINIHNKKYLVFYEKNKINIKSDHITCVATFNATSSMITLNVENMIFHDYNISSKGIVKIDYIKKNLYFIGNTTYNDVSMKINAQSTLYNANFYIQSDAIQDLKFIKNFIQITPEAQKWFFENIQGEYKINNLAFTIDIKKKILIPKSIEANIDVNNAKIKFKNNVSVINAKKINIQYANGFIKTKFHKPKFKNNIIENVILNVKNVDDFKNTIMNIEIYSTLPIDEDLNEILHGYNITLPFDYKKSIGTVKGYTKIITNFEKKTNKVSGEYEIINSTINTKKMQFFIQNMLINLKNKILTVKSKNISTLNKKINIKIDNLIANIEKNYIHGNLLIKKILIKKDLKKIINITNKHTSFNIKYDKSFNVNFNELGINVNGKSDNFNVVIKQIGSYIDNSDILKDHAITDANASLNISDNLITLKANINKHSLPFKVGQIELSGILKPNKIIISSEKININLENKILKIFLNNIDIDIKKIINQYYKNKIKSTKNDIKFELETKNSNLLYDNHKILSSYLKYSEDKNISSLISNYMDTKIRITTNKHGKIKFSIKNINEHFLNAIAANKQKFIKGGIIDINGDSLDINNTIINGDMRLKNTNFTNLSALTGVLTLVNNIYAVAYPLATIPTLFRLAKGDIQLDGYKVLDGKIKYTYNRKDNFLNIHQIKTSGAELDFIGNSLIDLNKKIIDAKVKAIFLKDASLVISLIPLINKIFLDDQKNISTKFNINGPLMKPEVSFDLFD